METEQKAHKAPIWCYIEEDLHERVKEMAALEERPLTYYWRKWIKRGFEADIGAAE